MTRFPIRTRIAAILAAAVVTGCETPPQAPASDAGQAVRAPVAPPPPPAPVAPPVAVQPPPPPVPPPPSAAQLRLKEANDLYDAGNFNGAIRKLSGSREVFANDVPVSVRVDAYKTLAFSYCVTGRRAPCRAQFDALLRLDRSFELSPAEAGHPLWGPVFQQAKKAAEAGSQRPGKTAPASR